MAAIFVVLGLLLTGIAYQAAGEFRDRRRYPPLGRLLTAGETLLHLLEQGSGEPVVFLEAGIAGSSLGWARVQAPIAQFTRVFSYDRAGLAWSAASLRPRNLENVLLELTELQRAAGIRTPIVLVGHSFGALLARAYAHRNPQAVSGLVLLDPASVATWAHCSAADRRRLAIGARLSRRGALLARLGIVRVALGLLAAGRRSLPRLIGKTTAGHGASTIARLIGEVQLLPPECAPRIRSHWSNPKCFRAMAEYLECLPVIAESIEHVQLPAHIAVTVLSASDATQSERRERERWAAESARGRHVVVDNSGHWIQIRRPDAVIAAVREMVELLR